MSTPDADLISPRLTLALQRLKAALTISPVKKAAGETREVSEKDAAEILEKADRFFKLLPPDARAELQLRGEFLREATKPGSRYAQCREAVLALFERPEKKGKRLLGADDVIERLYATPADIWFVQELRKVIELLRDGGPVHRERLNTGARFALFDDWLDECERLEDEAAELHSMGSYYLSHFADERRYPEWEPESERGCVARGMFVFGPVKLGEMEAAADSIMERLAAYATKDESDSGGFRSNTNGSERADGKDDKMQDGAIDVESRAIGVLAVHPTWTNNEIAAAIGTHPKYLSQLQKFKAAKRALKESSKQSIPRGSKTKKGEMEAWEADDSDK